MRLDFERIGGFIADGDSVLDLGCGGGDMLFHLRRTRQIAGVGAEINSDNLVKCLQKGVSAVHCDIACDLDMFGDNAFDAVVLSDTLQSIQIPPQKLIAEMLRIGRSAIVSFPNFGYWRMRLQLLSGAMPVGRSLPHEWHETTNVRYCTIHDFEELCRAESLQIKQNVFLCAERQVGHMPNIFAETAIYHLTRR